MDPKTGFPLSWPPKLAHVMKKAREAKKPFASIMEIRAANDALPIEKSLAGIEIREVQVPRISAPGLEATPTGSVAAEFVAETGSAFDTSLPHILYVHGGGYTLFSKESHRPITMRLAKHGIRVLSVSYRLAPEHPYPAAIVDAYACFKFLIASGVPASRIVVSGDSAGGGLTYALALYLRDLGEDMPGGLAPLTPWIDLSGTTPAGNINVFPEEADTLNSNKLGGLRDNAHAYSQGHWSNAYISPLLDAPNASSRPLPPQFITTGTCDRLQLEDLLMALKRRKAGEIVRLYDFKDMFHAFQAFPFLEASKTAIAEEAQFTKDVASGKNIVSGYFFVEGDGKTIKEESEGVVRERARDIVRRGSVTYEQPIAAYKL
ncbi:hypothetical protein SmJEL517_g00040 [Synchytrium microbalum]|uniref:Alpha/beta hydrolase fold-3 domain-containing protein n=1 Tax=Synchytrium microbalum TaxID=1806994 RepID=A0A507CAC8_9FUNG|nr:uncharacterized protein SmJEL517_g00040 [Synchytrium microbalum]TPX38037.1 hypothetical protein SmJEL517_g00040 [Synchytrium microbalum]